METRFLNEPHVNYNDAPPGILDRAGHGIQCLDHAGKVLLDAYRPSHYIWKQYREQARALNSLLRTIGNFNLNQSSHSSKTGTSELILVLIVLTYGFSYCRFSGVEASWRP